MRLDLFNKKIKKRGVQLVETSEISVSAFCDLKGVGEIEVTIDLCGKIWKHKVIVVDFLNSEMILGWNFLYESGANLGFLNGKYCIYWLDEKI